jgi:hypothetical protein
MNARPDFTLKGGNPHRKIVGYSRAQNKLNPAQRREVRLEVAARELIEDVMHRPRASGETREQVKEFLAELVRREIAAEAAK